MHIDLCTDTKRGVAMVTTRTADRAVLVWREGTEKKLSKAIGGKVGLCVIFGPGQRLEMAIINKANSDREVRW